MEFLVVRSGWYKDPKRMAVVKVINTLWDLLTVPEGVKVITKETSPTFWANERKRFGYHFYRYWSAWEEWKYCPSQYLAIVDIDVVPLRKDALVRLYSFLKEKVKDQSCVVTREPIAFAHDLWLSGDHSRGGLFLTPSEGFLILSGQVVPLVLQSECFHFLTSPLSVRVYGVKTKVGPYFADWWNHESENIRYFPYLKVMCLPETILVTDDRQKLPKVIQNRTDTCFFHPCSFVDNPQIFEGVISVLRSFLFGDGGVESI